MAQEVHTETPATPEQTDTRIAAEKNLPQNFNDLAKNLSAEQLKTMDTASMGERVTRAATERGVTVPEAKSVTPELASLLKGMSSEQLLALNAAIHEEVLSQERARRTADITPTISVDLSKVQPADARGLQQQVSAVFTPGARAEVAQEAPAVPFATGAGGGMQPPHDPANDNQETSPGRQTLIDRAGLASVEHAVIARTPMDPNGMIDTTGALSYRSDLINQFGVEAVRQELATAAGGVPPIEPPEAEPEVTPEERETPTEPTAVETPQEAPEVPPQTEAPVNHPAFENPPKESKEDTQKGQSHGILGRTWARVERLGIKVVNAPKWAGLETMRQFQSQRAAKAELAVKTAQEQVQALEDKLASRIADQDARIQKMGSGFFDRLAAAKLAREKEAIVTQIDKAKSNLAAAMANLEFKKGKETYWDERLEQQAHTIAAGVEEKLAPSKAEYEVQSAKHEEVSKALEVLKQNIDAIQSDILLFEVRLKHRPDAAEKAEIKNGLQAAKDQLVELTKAYSETGKQKSAAFAKVNRAKLYLNGWSDLHNAE